MVRLAILALLLLLVAKEFGYLDSLTSVRSMVGSEPVKTHCFGTESPADRTVELHQEPESHRFHHCKAGDLISVYTAIPLQSGAMTSDVFTRPAIPDNKAEFAPWVDEVGKYCSTDYPIVSIGATKIGETYGIQWFDCLFIGRKRPGRGDIKEVVGAEKLPDGRWRLPDGEVVKPYERTPDPVQLPDGRWQLPDGQII